jgi:hypothetical protein
MFRLTLHECTYENCRNSFWVDKRCQNGTSTENFTMMKISSNGIDYFIFFFFWLPCCRHRTHDGICDVFSDEMQDIKFRSWYYNSEVSSYPQLLS